MRISRRQFLKYSLLTGAASGLAGTGILSWPGRACAFSQSPALKKFIQPLPGLGSKGIPIASKSTRYPGMDYYKIRMMQFTQQMHPDLPKATTVWGYVDVTSVNRYGSPQTAYLGPIILANRGTPVRITFENRLPNKHILPIDTTIMGAEPGQPQNRATVHLHGGKASWTSDGSPFSWFTPDPTVYGPCWRPGDYLYPNDQSARLLWYHDHAIGITRLNAYAGLAAGYVLVDEAETMAIAKGWLPPLLEQIPLVIQDKTFKPVDDEWGLAGDLWYPWLYEPSQIPPGRWDYGPLSTPPAVIPNKVLPVPSAVPEFFADTIVVNGAVFPALQLQPQRYRFRILNGSQARTFNLQLYYASSLDKTEPNLNAPGPNMVQIGTEGGFLAAPVELPNRRMRFDQNNVAIFNDPSAYNLLLSPAERADVVIDFSNVKSGSTLILYNDAPAPFPMGDSLNDYAHAPFAPDNYLSGGALKPKPGCGPDTRTIMQIRIAGYPPTSPPPQTRVPGGTDPLAVPPYESNPNGQNLRTVAGTIPTTVISPFNGQPIQPAQVRDFTTTEDFDEWGRLIQGMGTTVQNGLNNQGLPTYRRPYCNMDYDPVNDMDIIPNRSVEIWKVWNLTMDMHPMHMHVGNAQVLWRAVMVDNFHFDPNSVRLPDPNEIGWKETIRMNPGEVTVIAVFFEAPPPPPWVTGNNNQFPATSSRDCIPSGKYEYVWHCHILEHEEHDMMRPLLITP